MQTTIRYFASVRETVGLGSETLDLPDSLRTLAEVRVWLAARSSRHALALGQDTPLRMACNQVACGADAPVADGAEVAFFPPVTGG